jgi:hypothetical protein
MIGYTVSGMVSIGGRKVVGREPETAELELVHTLAIDRIVRMDPVGDCVSERSSTDRAIENLPKHIVS